MSIDRELAEKVMGWHEEMYSWRQRGWFDDENIWQVNVVDWHPSTDISQAFQVVEKMGDGVWWLNIKKSSDGYYVEIRKNRAVASGWAESDTLEMAICLAVLEAKGG
ncbi:MAG: hypothetical protein KKD77_22000 [Gammaproteobacteria bacterium]|nr:hypothetical protein [Gammaproteobacteria bacterium]MBU2685928.1 hypothetical protein [Gammaproteobacteria bacterium]